MSDIEIIPLSLQADVVMGQSPESDRCTSEEGGLPFLQGSAEFGARHPTHKIFCNPPMRVAKAGSVLISVRAPVGEMNFADQDYCIGRGLGGVRSKFGEGDTIFLRAAIEHGISYLHRRSQGSTFAAVAADDIRSMPIPNFCEQDRKFVSRVYSVIESAIEKTEILIEKYQQIKAGLMHDLFTRGVLPNGQLRPRREDAPELYKETALGWLPLEWRTSNCGAEFEVDSGITLGPHRRPSLYPKPYLRVANVYRGDLRLDDVAKLEMMAGDEGLTLKVGDILMVEGHANRLEIARCAMVTQNAQGFLFQNHLFRLRPRVLNNNFSLHWLNSHHAIKYWDDTCSSSSGLNTINRRMLNGLPIFIPSENEQIQIAEMISAFNLKLEREQLHLEKMQAKKTGLMQDLLTGKVSV